MSRHPGDATRATHAHEAVACGVSRAAVRPSPDEAVLQLQPRAPVPLISCTHLLPVLLARLRALAAAAAAPSRGVNTRQVQRSQCARASAAAHASTAQPAAAGVADGPHLCHGHTGHAATAAAAPARCSAAAAPAVPLTCHNCAVPLFVAGAGGLLASMATVLPAGPGGAVPGLKACAAARLTR
jgi:hypothetical protein